MAVSFKNSPLTLFLVAISGLFVAALSIGAFNGYYYSSKKEGVPLNNISYGQQIPVKDLFKEQKLSYPWLNDGNFTFEARTKINGEKSETLNNVIIYDKASNSLKFDGVGKGTLWFISTMDASVYLHIDFECSFRNKDLGNVIAQQYPSLMRDNFLSRKEIQNITTFNLDNYETFDGSDLGNFTSLQSITISGNKVTKITNNKVDNDVKIYVQKELYNEYMASEAYNRYRDRLFPEVENNDSYVVVLYKEGGTLFDSWDKDYDTREVKKGQPFTNIPSSEDIILPGSTFQGWFDESGKEYTNKSVINQDTKLFAKWSRNVYPVNYFVETDIVGQYDTYTDNYFYQNDLVIKDIGQNYNSSERVFIGWSTNKDATTVEYAPGYKIEGYFDGVNKGFDLYAVFAWKTLHIKIYNDNTVIMSRDCSYGNSFLLKYDGSEPVGAGKFSGYSLDRTAKSKDYDDNSTVNVEYNFENPSDIYHIYRTTKQNQSILFYCIFDPTEQFSIFYKVTNANEIREEYTQTYCKDGDASTGTLIPNRPVTLRHPESFYKNQTQNIDKVGKHFIGWLKNSGNTEILYTNLDDITYGNATIVKLNNYVLASGFDKCENVVLTPVYQSNTLYITYEGKNATTYYKSTLLFYGQELRHAGSYTRTGHTFSSFTVSCKNNVTIMTIEKTSVVTPDKMKEIYTIAMSIYGYSRHEQAVNMDIMFSANWNINSYTVSFNSEGGYSVSSQQVKYGDKVRNPGDPGHHDSSYHFQYWYLNDESTQFDFANFAVTNNLTLHAKWEKSCLAEGSLITLADGSKEKVENINLGDEVLTWNFFEGRQKAYPVMYLKANYIVCDAYVMKFDNGETITSIGEHAYFNYTKKQFVEVCKDHYKEFINDEFYFEDGVSRLVSIEQIAYSGNCYVLMPVVTGNCFANGALNTIPEYIPFTGLAPINDNMCFDEQILADNFLTYGYASYEDYAEYLSEDLFNAYGGIYLNVMFGLGIIDIDTLLVFSNDFYNGD